MFMKVPEMLRLNHSIYAARALAAVLTALLSVMTAAGQVQNKWPNRSESARKLLTYMADNTGMKILTGVHACVNYNTNEADWVYHHTGKYPAINTIDFIHDIYSNAGGWIDYDNQTLWKDWTKECGLIAAMWHWNMPTNDGRGVHV